MNADDGARAQVTAADQLAGHQATAQGNLMDAHLDALTATPPHLPNVAVFHGSLSEPPATGEEPPVRGSLQPIRPGESHPSIPVSPSAVLGQPAVPVGLETRQRPSDYPEEFS